MAKLTTDEQALGAATSHQNKHCGRDVLGAGNAQCMACVHVCIDYVCLLVVLAVVGRTNIQGQCVATAKGRTHFHLFFSHCLIQEAKKSLEMVLCIRPCAQTCRRAA